MSAESIQELKRFSACDISDALLALEKPAPGQRSNAGFLSDLVNLSGLSSKSTSRSENDGMLIYPAFNVQFRSTSSSTASENPTLFAAHSNIPQGLQWSDLTQKDTVVVIQQPPGQKCAVVGGIHMLRLWKRGVKGLIVEGRIRDISALEELEMPIWAKGTSTVGAAAETKAHAIQTTVAVSEVPIEPGDLICIDGRENGVVRIPRPLVDEVLAWLRKRGNSEDRILETVRDGESVADAFKKFR